MMGVNFVDQNHQFISEMTIFFNLVGKRMLVLKFKELGIELLWQIECECVVCIASFPHK